MKMEKVDWVGDILAVVAQEAGALVDLLCQQNNNALDQILALVEPGTRDHLRSLTNIRDRVSAIVGHFRTSDCITCRQFVRTVLQYCDNIPFLLETTLVSIAEHTSETNFNHTSDTDKSSPSRDVKRQRLDHLLSYTDALKSMLLQKHEAVTQSVVKDIRLDDTWVYLKHRNHPRAKDRTTQPQVSQDHQEGEDTLSEHKVSVESLLKSCGRVVVLLGQAGSGKTLLVHCLGQSWAHGSFPSIHLLFLLEFRQLNLMSRDLSLKELLFLFYPPSEDFNEQSEAVLAFIFSNPEKVCFIFDGYDEFRAKLTNPETLDSAIDPNKPLSMPDLLSGLCNRKILPNCTVLVTCRPRDVTDMFGSPGFITCELLGFDRLGVKEYAEEYFHKKGDELKQKAVSLLMDNRHLLSMSQVPGLCHICCVCMDYLFSSGGTCGNLHLPVSLTQIYIQILLAFLSRFSEGKMSGASLLQRYRSKITELSLLALKGLEKSSIVFMATEVSGELQDFGVRAGILSRVKLTREDGSSGHGFTFMHLTMQEFLTALHLMTSSSITESQLKKKLNLKTRWTAKTDPKSVFTDSLHLYVCGLAAEACTFSLAQLKGTEGATAWVEKRQAAVRSILHTLAGSASQTGPKFVELCRCAHETQDAELASAVGSRPKFELRNIRLNAVDMEALAFVTAAADQNVCLDIGGCSIHLDCLDILPSFRNVDHLIFRSRKYDDKFAEALCNILSKLQALRRLDFISGGLTDVGAAKLARALRDCPNIAHVNVSDNSLKDEGVRELAETLSRLPNICSVVMGRNSTSTDGVLQLTKKMAACPSVQKVHVEGNKEINVVFSQSSDTVCEQMDLNHTEEAKHITLKHCNITCAHVADLCTELKDFLTILDLSSNSLGNKGLKKILDLLPKLGMIQEINFSKNGINMDGLVLLVSALCTQKSLRRVDASDNGNEKLVLWFDTNSRTATKQQGQNKTGSHQHKKLSLTHSNIQPTYMTKLCKQLVKCENLLDIEFSHLKLSNQSIKTLMLNLPEMSSLQLINLSHVEMSVNGALSLVRSLVDCQRVTAVELRHGAEAFIKFVPVKSEAAICKLAEYQLSTTNVEKLSRILEDCPHLAELDLSHNLLRDEGVKCFADCLPKLKISSFVSLHGNRMTQVGALHLVNSMNTCEKVVAVEVSLGVEDQTLIQFVHERVKGKTLRLRECRFEVDHLQKLVEILRRCPRLLTLELSSNSLQNPGLFCLLDSLAKLSTIQTVSLRNNALSCEQVEYFLKQLGGSQQHRDIRIEESWMTGAAVVSLVGNCLNLDSHIGEIRVNCACINVIIEAGSNLSSTSAAHSENRDLPPCALRSISFDDCDVEGHHLTSLILPMQKCHTLQNIKFARLKMDRKGSEFFSAVIPSLAKLRDLTLDLKGATEDEVIMFVEALPKTPAFENLSLSQLVMGNSGAAVFGRSLQNLPHLKSLSLSWNECGDTLARKLSEILPQCKMLKRLDLEANKISTTGAVEIAKWSHVVGGLVKCLSLAEIRLNSLVLDEEGISTLAQGFGSMKSLRKLSLNNIKVETAETTVNGAGKLCLLASFQAFRQMEEVDLESWRMGDGGTLELVKHIPSWTELRILNLSDNSMSDEAGEKLLDTLSHCRSLQKLQLSKNRLGQVCAAKLAQVLPGLSQISELDLSVNQFGPQGSVALCEGLVGMKALRRLNLTSIGSSDLVGVASSLKYCPSIEDVSLSWNECGDTLARKLSEILPQCKMLKRLDLEANKISTTGAVEIAKCLPSCSSIELIRLWRNPIAKDDENLKDHRLNFSSV